MTILDNILAGIIAALIVALGVLLILNADLRADLARADANAVTLGRVNADLKDATVKQNTAIAGLQAASDVKSRAAEKAVKASALAAKQAEARVAVIARQPDAKNAADDCADATKILRDYLGTR